MPLKHRRGGYRYTPVKGKHPYKGRWAISPKPKPGIVDYYSFKAEKDSRNSKFPKAQIKPKPGHGLKG